MSAGTRRRTDAIASAAGGLLIVAAVAVIYRAAIVSFLFNDDFNWFDEARRFAFANLFHLDRYNHFYRLNTLILYLFARELTGGRWFAFLAALFFCTQPGYFEAVAWIAAITDLLPGLWYLLTLWLYLRYLH